MPVRRSWQIGDRVKYATWPHLGTVTAIGVSATGRDVVQVTWDDVTRVSSESDQTYTIKGDTVQYRYHQESLLKVTA